MRLNFKWLHLGAAIMTGLLFSTGCTKDEAIRPLDDQSIEERGLINGSPVNTALIGLTPTNELVNLMSGPPVVDLGIIPITGLRDSGEFVLAIDTRPSNKQLYGVSNYSLLYTINTTTGVATPVSQQSFVPAINGATIGLDFTAQNDQLRLVTETGQNLRINPTTGLVIAVDPALCGLGTGLNSIAYTYPQGTTPPLLYGLDPKTGFLHRQAGSTGGALSYVGDTGFQFAGDGGFEITSGQTAFAVQFGRSRLGPVFGSDPQYDDISQETHRLMKIDLRKAKVTSYGRVRPMIGLAVK